MWNKVARDREVALARLAARQHGVISTAQLLGLGFSRTTISRKVAAGQLHRVYRGVYAVGHAALGSKRKWKAATLAVADSVLSHRSAAELWGLFQERPGPVHVSLGARTGRERRPGIVIHRLSSLPDADATLRAGIPVSGGSSLCVTDIACHRRRLTCG
jgi:predicted transcriptional regulator of viral defense system